MLFRTPAQGAWNGGQCSVRHAGGNRGVNNRATGGNPGSPRIREGGLAPGTCRQYEWRAYRPRVVLRGSFQRNVLSETDTLIFWSLRRTVVRLFCESSANHTWSSRTDRKSDVSGKRVSVRVHLGGRRSINKKNNRKQK